MLTKMHLKNFKGFRDTEIPEFRKVNLILGGQNVGKTSLLEAVVFAAGDMVDTKNSLNRLPKVFRPNEGADSRRFWTALVGSENSPIEVLVCTSIGKRDYVMGGYASKASLARAEDYLRSNLNHAALVDVDAIDFHLTEFGGVRWIFGVTPKVAGLPAYHVRSKLLVPASYPVFPLPASEQVYLYGQLVLGKKKKAIVELLKRIEPKLESIDAVAPDGEHRVYADLSDGQVLPLSQLGHGFTRLFELYSGLAVTDSKLALIDEIENGIHYSALPTVFQGIRELADSNGVQSVITTHSLEAIKAACEVFKDKPEDFQLIRLERTNDDNIRAVAINDENLQVVMASGWEMR